MKITRDSRKVDKRQLAKAEANKGISRGAYRCRTWAGKRKDLYKCYTCGAEWESEWYKDF